MLADRAGSKKPDPTRTPPGRRRRRQGRRRTQRTFAVAVASGCWLFSLFAGILSATAVASASASATSSSTVKKRSRDVSTQTVIQIIETETFTGGTWKEGGWTDVNGDTVESPESYTLGPHQEWVGEWKIAVAKGSPHGWEYVLAPQAKVSPLLQYSERRRTWLRTVTRTQQKPVSRAMQAVKDDWNFKGFGVNLYKSAVFPESFGVALRLPVTFNLDTWERHPALPSVSMAMALYYPPCAIVFINTSMRMEWIQWALQWISVSVPALLSAALLVVLRGLALAVSAVLFPLTRKPLLKATTTATKKSRGADAASNDSASPWKRRKAPPLVYSRTVEERLGMSLSWRVSASRGYEFRVSYWHFFAPSLAMLLERVNLPVPRWIPRRSAALACSLSGPVKDDGVIITASTVVSLSGYYFGSPKRSSEVQRAQNKKSRAEKQLRETAPVKDTAAVAKSAMSTKVVSSS